MTRQWSPPMTSDGSFNKLFVPHGRFEAYVDGRLIISQVTGPWNKELIDAWAKALHPLAKAVSADGPHVGIAIIHGSMLCPPDALVGLRKVVSYSVRHMDNIGHAIVADSSVEGRGLLAQTFARIYEGLVPYCLFDNLPAAKSWGQQLLRECMEKRAIGKP